MIFGITGIIGLSVALAIIVLIRNDNLHVRHGMLWIMVAVSFSLLGFFPSLIDTVSEYLGVSYPPILALTVGFGIGVIKLLIMDIERSKLEVRYERLIQRLALLENEIIEKGITQQDKV